jgi:hypothetical protein
MVAQTVKRRAMITPIFTGRSRRGLEGELVCGELAAAVGFGMSVVIDVGVMVEEEEVKGCEFEDCEVAALVWEVVDVAAALYV